jgi:hypothetical protein
MPISPEQSQTAFDAVTARIAPTHKGCPMCGANNWGSAHYYAVIPFTEDPLKVTPGSPEPMTPAAVLVCQSCGFVALHALDVLGIVAPN